MSALLDDALRRLTGRRDAVLRDDQQAAIDALVTDRDRVLVVQRTGWGKSAVYFLACLALRQRGDGPTLLVSPLLALMRDQLRAAERAGLRAERIDSTNVDDWDDIVERLHAGEVDLLAVGPERLANPDFVRDVLDPLADRLGLLVVDEAHAASAWGHDFRPDYRRIADLLDRLAPDTPVLACTATATQRVVDDLAALLGLRPDRVLRGALERTSLHVRVVDRPDTAARVAWLAAWALQQHQRGRKAIVFALTVGDAEMLAAAFAEAGHPAVRAYHGRLDADERVALEASLASGEVTCLAATSALGMGYDLPDLAAVAHYGLPGTLLDLYQAIGRAGRALPEAEVVEVPTPQQADIWAWFDSVSLPSDEQIQQVLGALSTEEPLSVVRMEPLVPVSRTRLETLLKVLAVDGVVDRVRGGWVATGRSWEPDPEVRAGLQRARKAEHRQVERWIDDPGCRMANLLGALDDAHAPDRCGRCDNCGHEFEEVEVTDAVREGVREVLVGSVVEVPVRKQWPTGLADLLDDEAVLADGAVPKGRLSGLQPAGIRALGRRGDGIIDPLLEEARHAIRVGEALPQRLVDQAIGVLRGWPWEVRPVAALALASDDEDGVVAGALADRLAELGRLRRLEDQRATVPLEAVERQGNSVHVAAMALRTTATPELPPGQPLLLVTGPAESGWPQTVAVAKLRAAGAGAVHVLALSARA